MAGIAMINARALVFLHLLICCLLPLASSLSFNYTTFDYETPGIKYEGGASSNFGRFDVSKNRQSPINNNSGRVWYAHPVPLWENATGEVATFTTQFSFFILATDSQNKGDGMAFFLASYPSRMPENSYGQNLGLTNQSVGAVASGDSRFLAVEFDTFPNYLDPTITHDHLGIDVNSIVSVQNLSLPNFSLNGSMTATITYDNISSMLDVTLRLANQQSYNFNSTIDLKGSLPEQVAVGFSASTGALTKLHQVLSWSFSSSLQPKEPPPPPSRGLVVGVSTGAASFILLCALAAVVLYHRSKKKKVEEEEEENRGSEDDEPTAEIEMEVGPKRFPYQRRQATSKLRRSSGRAALGQSTGGT